MARRRYEHIDEQFERIKDLLPEVESRGCAHKDHRQVINGIFRILRLGAPLVAPSRWLRQLEDGLRSLPTEDRKRSRAHDGTLERIVRQLQGELDAEGRIEWS